MERQEILRHLNKYWDTAIKRLHNTAPKDKKLQTTSGDVERSMHILYNKHRENLIELFSELEGLKEES